ncbi:ABC transporter ATP-binding protein, partial [Anaerolinea sp.]|uniref:ABC transporter ATP-binding protein n=1 Tax=Anaerolinea sp. TaxID=1872519 RepID=UPI002ACD7CE1
MKPSGWKVLRFLKPYWLWIVLAPLLMLLEVVMDLMQPRMVERIVDQGIANLDLPFVLQTGLLMFGLAVIGATGGMSNGIFAEMTVQGFGADLREALFRKVQSFSFRNLDAFETGQLITRLTSDVAQLQEGVLITLRMLVRAPLLLIGSLVMAIVTSPQLAFLPLVLMPIELLAVVWIVRKATPLFTLVQEKLDALNGVMEENLSGMRVVKAFARAAHEKQRFAHANRALTDQAVRAGRTVAVMPSFMMLTMNLGIVGVLWFGGVQVVRGGMQVGQIIAFVNYLMTTLFSLMMVSQMVIQFSRAEASARRIEEVLETEPELQDAPNAIRDVRLKGHIVFDRVTFRYDGADSEPVLKEVSFTAQPGETVALLGMTGAGKSTLVHLIPRFYDVQGGRILIDGMDVRE